jgi:hypothetical protein
MSTTRLHRVSSRTRNPGLHGFALAVVVLLVACLPIASPAAETALRVMATGLGSGTIVSDVAGISCGGDCVETYASAVPVTLTASPDPGSTFSGWLGDCSGTAPCTVTMDTDRSVRAEFGLATAIPTITGFEPEDLATYLTDHPEVNTPARFVAALPPDFKQNWLLMARSESLQTGTAEFPRMLLPDATARFVFSLGLATHGSYPGAHPNAIEFMQWDGAQKNFRFHEIVLDDIPQMGSVPPRPRGVSIDDSKCFRCHSTRNVKNRGTTAGTTGVTPETVQFKSKPNWDAYDSWGGLLAFNRDRIYQGSVEAAAFRTLFNPWTWHGNAAARSVIEQLELQPPGVSATQLITRMSGGANDGHVNFGFDASPPVFSEPAPTGSAPARTTNYSFNGAPGTGPQTQVVRGGPFVTLHHSEIPVGDEGRAVHFFDLLGGFGALEGNPGSQVRTNLNAKRIVDEVIHHRFATGGVPIDVRPIALAITKQCLSIDAATNRVTSTPPLTVDLGFFDARHGMGINELVTDTRNRARTLPRRKADIQKLNLDRTDDLYLDAAPSPGENQNGQIQLYGWATSFGLDTSLGRLRQEVFRRPVDFGSPDTAGMGIYVDRERYDINTDPVALFRYFLEPLGVSVDKWSMGVRGRSRTYTFADVFGTYLDVFQARLEDSLTSDPVAGLTNPDDCAQLIAAVNGTLSFLPPANAVPTYTDVQRIFNKSCIECHGGLDYPPYANYGTFFDISEDESPPAGQDRLDRSYAMVTNGFVTTSPATSYLYQRITDSGSAINPGYAGATGPYELNDPAGPDEGCPYGVMPCGGPPLSQADILTIRRWIVGPPAAANTRGDPHVKTLDGINYDFQAAGEFVLLRGQGVEVQARQTPVATEGPLGPNPHTGLTSCVSVNSAVAVGVGGSRITYEPDLSGKPNPAGLQLRVDGKSAEVGPGGLNLPFGGRIVRTSAPGGIQIEAPGGGAVVITPVWWAHYQLWYLNVDTSHIRAAAGVMGAVGPGNWLPALPDGTRMGHIPEGLAQRYRDLYGKFGQAWRVSDASSLFDYAPGTSTDTFNFESWPRGESPQSCPVPPQPGGPPTQTPMATLPLQVAQQQCSGIVADDARANCIQDVRVTGEPGFAKAYLLSERIERNAAPEPPALMSPARFATGLAGTVAFTWERASDADGETVKYRHCVWDAHTAFSYRFCDATPGRMTSWRAGLPCAGLALLIGVLLIVILILMRMRNRRVLLTSVALATLAAAVLALYICGGKSGTKTVAGLESGKAYFWKVVAEDGEGGNTQSETRRFTVK